MLSSYFALESKRKVTFFLSFFLFLLFLYLSIFYYLPLSNFYFSNISSIVVCKMY